MEKGIDAIESKTKKPVRDGRNSRSMKNRTMHLKITSGEKRFGRNENRLQPNKGDRVGE